MRPDMKIDRILLPILALLGIVLGAYLIPRVNPFFASRPEITRSQAREMAGRFFADQNLDPEGFFSDEIFIYDISSLDYLMEMMGVAPAIALGQQERLPLSHWELNFYRNAPRDQQLESYQIRVSPSGKLLGYKHILPDSAASGALSSDEAERLAQHAVQSWPDIELSAFKLEQSTGSRKLNRTDHKLLFSRAHSEFGQGREVVEVNISGSEVTGVTRYYRPPEGFVSASGLVGLPSILLNTASAIVFVVLLFGTLIAFLRKYHEGEIGVRTGLWLGGILLVTMLLYSVNHWERAGYGTMFGPISTLITKFIAVALALGFGYNFMAIMTLSGWTVGEHHLRGERPRLFSGVDSLFRRKWLTKNMGRELPAGLASGFLLFGAIQIISQFLIKTTAALPRLSYDSYSSFEGYLPLLSIVIFMIICAVFDEIVFRLFLISSLRRWLKSTPAAIVVSALLYGTFLIFFGDTMKFRPVAFTLVPTVFIGLFQGVVFWRYGLLAAMSSCAAYSALFVIAPLLGSPSPFFLGNGIAGVVLLAGLLALGFIGWKKGEDFHYTPEDEPAHIRRIKERVRLQKELEIARRVQIGLLPKVQPLVKGFDIAGACLPALEVGGDYFDFVELVNGNLGIAVGDVSGKGVPAAIYMTLTKGILQSHAGEELSPKRVLGRVNQLMYRTIERNWYVSMFYAVLDCQRRQLRFARAGHNPGIMFRRGENEARLLQTAGIGLGLDAGQVFTRTLVEGELQLNQGDTMVLYTDGFTEAMNPKMEEFGDERFLELLQKYRNSTAEALVHGLFDEVRHFAGDHPQHDDMTLVVLKAI